MTTDKLVAELARLMIAVSYKSQQGLRVRIAVSPDEIMQIREYLKNADGRWHQRLSDMPLIVDDTPFNPPRMKL